MSPRVVAPIVLALLCVAALIVFLWWQLKSASGLLGNVIHTGTGDTVAQEDTLLDDIDPRDEALLKLRQGDLHALRGEWADAEKSYQESVNAGGGLSSLRKLAKAQLQRRQFDAVRDTIKKLRSADAREEDMLLLESSVLIRTGELVRAREMLEKAAESPQKNYGMAMLSLIEGNHTAAQEQLKLVEQGWDPLLRSYAKVLLGAYDEYALFPESTDAHLISLLSRGLAQVDECELALPLLSQVTHSMENYRDAWIVQGFCELSTERPEQALASLEHAYSIDPQKPEIQYFLARTYAALGQHDNAITFLEYAIINGFYPEQEARMLLAKEALTVGKADVALTQYEEMTAAPDATIETYEGFVAVAVALQKTEEAHLKAMEATEKWKTDAKAFELLGTAAAANGKNDEARDAFERALDLNPGLISAQEKLNALR